MEPALNLEKRTWNDDVLDGKISVLKMKGQTIVRMPAEMGQVLGDKEILDITHKLFGKPELVEVNFYDARGFAVYQNPKVHVYEVTLPSMIRHEDMHGPDVSGYFVHKILEKYDRLAPTRTDSD